MFALLRQTVLVFLGLTVVTGVAYPVVMTVVAQVVFPHQANGSLIERNGKLVGSALIGQQFDDPGYFWSRPSATGPTPYNAAASRAATTGRLTPRNSMLCVVESMRCTKRVRTKPGRCQSI